MQDANEGVLTVKLIFINDVLKIEILNAHCIRSMDSNGRNLFIKDSVFTESVFFFTLLLIFQVSVTHLSKYV